MRKKLWRHILFSSYFCCYRKHPNNDNNDNKACPLPSSSCFQQHFHDWFSVLRYNSDLSKLEWTPLLFNFNCFCDLTNRRKIFSIPVAEFTSFSHQARALITNLLGFISTFSKYYFEIGTICLLFSSAHLFTALEFHGNHFAILLSKMVKPHDHNKIKLSIGKIFPKYIKKRILFCDVPKIIIVLICKQSLRQL